jgi:hypothetical protein
VQRFEIECNSPSRLPNQVGMVMAPILVTRNAEPIAGQIQAVPYFPVGTEDRRDPHTTRRPELGRKGVGRPNIPRPRRRRDLWIARAIEAEAISFGRRRPRRRRDLNDGKGPSDLDQLPASAMLAELEGAGSEVDHQRTIIRRKSKRGIHGLALDALTGNEREV